MVASWANPLMVIQYRGSREINILGRSFGYKYQEKPTGLTVCLIRNSGLIHIYMHITCPWNYNAWTLKTLHADQTDLRVSTDS